MPEPDTSALQDRLAIALAGQYTVVRALGQGGMGTVFLARDITLDREVAIKVIAPELATSSELRQRFLQEARTVAKLRHPNIVAVYTAGEGNGLLYFVMEFVPGESLRDRMTREHVLSAEAAVSILSDLALALDYAHQSGVVHRDVKPENILLDRESGRSMLTDFGVAVALAAAGDGRLTGAGFVLGSPRYMSPEQAAGERSLDGRSDLYSLGLIGYEMFSGDPAIDAPTAASILVKQLTERPEPLKQKASGTPLNVASSIDRVLEKNPGDRFTRGAEFAAALVGETFDNATPANQIGRPHAQRTAKAQPKKKRAAIIAAVVAAFVAAVGATMFINRTPGNARMYFIAPFEVQTPDRTLDWLHEGSVNMLSLALSQWTDLSVVDYERSLDLLRDSGLGEKQRIGLEDARAVARKAGAGTVIMGTVTSTHDSLNVVARLYSVQTGRKLDEAQRSVRAGEDPRGVFQAIASDLLNLAGGPKVTVELAKATTTSVDAYRLYLDGVRALNAWRLAAADSLLLQATKIDSTFALAYYKRALTLGWESLPDRQPHLTASQKAVDFKDRLPPRLQEIVLANNDLTRALFANSTGSRALFDAARGRLAKLVKSDSLDSEAWYGLADAQFHEAILPEINSVDSLAGLLNQSARSFRRAIAIDSTNHLAYQHLVGIYQIAAQTNGPVVLDGDSLRNISTPEGVRAVGGADRVQSLRTVAKTRSIEAAAGWLAADPDARQAYRSLSDAYVQLANYDSAAAVLERSNARATTSSPVTPYHVALLQLLAQDPRAIQTVRRALQQYPADSIRARGEPDRMSFVMGALSVSGASGSVALMDTIFRTVVRADSLMPGTDVTTQNAAGFFVIAMRLGMGLPLSDADRRSMLRGMEIVDRVQTPMYQQIRATSVALPYAAYLTSRDKVFSDEARKWSVVPGAAANAAPLLPELNALEALSKGDTATAAQLVREFPSVDSLKKASLGMAGLRVYARAQAAAGVGDLRRAVGYYEAIDPKRFTSIGMTEPGFAFYVRSFLERARLYEKLGEPDKAIVAYDEFVKRWKDADAPLQSQVSEARQAAARLRDNPKSVPVGVKPGRGT